MSDIIERLHGPDGMEAGQEILRLREENARLRSLLGEVLSVWGVYYWPADIYRRAKAAIREGATDE